MRLILRIIGTWLLGLALILLIIDGTRSLGANRLIMTSMADTWAWLSATSLEATRQFIASRLLGPLLEGGVDAVLGAPGWLVLAVPGVLLAWMGRSRRTRMFVGHDQI
jgi:hypothetical protein